MASHKLRPKFQLTPSTAVADEVILTLVAGIWALLLWLPTGPVFLPDSGFAYVESAIGGEAPLASALSLLVFFQVVAFFHPKWPPNWRLRTLFAASMWWTWVAFEALLGRWYSPSWATAACVAALSYMTWLRARRITMIGKTVRTHWWRR